MGNNENEMAAFEALQETHKLSKEAYAEQTALFEKNREEMELLNMKALKKGIKLVVIFIFTAIFTNAQDVSYFPAANNWEKK